GMAGVVAALGADDHIGLGGEVVDDLALALIAPLAADQDDDHLPVLFGPGVGPPGLEVVEAGVVAAELELDGAGGAVAVLRHMDLGNPGLLVGFLVLWPIKKHYN